MRNIVVCCDGTANEFAADRTNVVKLFWMLVQAPDRQISCYHPGLGTMEPPGALTRPTRGFTRLLGKAFGYGLAADIGDAYRFLVENYEPGDRIFLFGFSRGAYTVRAVASLLRLYGLVPRGNSALIPYVVRMFMRISTTGADSDTRNAYFRLADEFKECFGASRTCLPWFLGVWDTVSSVGWVGQPVALPYTRCNPDIRHVRHAVALDERRAFFRTNLFDAAPEGGWGEPQILRQVWFPGAHCDVGGGYNEAEADLSRGALRWMAEEAIMQGLLVDADKLATLTTIAPDRPLVVHESLSPRWWAAEFVPKRHYDATTGRWGYRMNLFRRRTVPTDAVMHPNTIAAGTRLSEEFS